MVSRSGSIFFYPYEFSFLFELALFGNGYWALESHSFGRYFGALIPRCFKVRRLTTRAIRFVIVHVTSRTLYIRFNILPPVGLARFVPFLFYFLTSLSHTPFIFKAHNENAIRSHTFLSFLTIPIVCNLPLDGMGDGNLGYDDVRHLGVATPDWMGTVIRILIWEVTNEFWTRCMEI